MPLCFARQSAKYNLRPTRTASSGKDHHANRDAPPVQPHAIPATLSDFAAENAPEEFLRNVLPRMTLHKLRRGNVPVQDKPDPHGNCSDAASKTLREFLLGAIQRGSGCVRAEHGKGSNSRGGETVVRKPARHWLTQHPHVLAFCFATPREEGGSGAALALLKASS